MATDLVLVLLFAASLAIFAVLRGGRPERLGAAIIILGIVVDRAWTGFFGYRDFLTFDGSRLALDLVQMAAFLWLALRANRVWPLWISAAQAVAITGSIAALVLPDGYNYAFWAITQAPLFVQLFALAVGIAAHHRRVRRVGEYNCWSPRRPEKA